jgi:ABC-2 type transport system permease protein
MREVRVVGEFIGSPDDAQRLTVEGKASAIVLIPSSFSTDIKKGAKGHVLVGVDMSNVLVGKNVQKAIAKAVGTVGAGVQLTTVKKMGARRDAAMAAVVPVLIEENLSFNPATNYTVYIVPALLFFLLHIWTIVVVSSVFLPNRGPECVRAKIGAMAAVVVMALALAFVFLRVHLPWVGIDPASGGAAILVLTGLLLVSDVLLTTALFSVIPRPIMAMEVAVAIAMLSLMLSGITWPTDLFPPGLQRFSDWIPFTPFAQGIRSLVHYPTSLGETWPWCSALLRQSVLYAALIVVGSVARIAAASYRHRRIAW